MKSLGSERIPDCDGHVALATQNLDELEAVAVPDPQLQDAARVYFSALLTIASDCDGSAEELARSYERLDSSWNRVRVRELQLRQVARD